MKILVLVALVVLSCIILIPEIWADYAYLSQFGSQGNGDGQFDGPSGVAIDSSGNIYVVDTNNHRIQKFNSEGVYLSQFGSEGNGDGQFAWPRDIAFDSAGNIYIADNVNYRVQKFNSEGVYLSQFGSEGNGNGQFARPFGIALDSSGNIYVADNGNFRIQKFNSEGVYLSQFGSQGNGNGQFASISDIALDSSGNIYVADTYNNRIQKFNSEGVYGFKFGSRGDGIAFDSSGNIYIADYGNFRIQKFTIVEHINFAPIVGNDIGATTNEDTPVPITLVAEDEENDPITYSVVTQPSNGKLAGTGPNLTYIPNLNYFGTDTFTFKANDGTVDSTTEIATIKVNPVNDIPVSNAGIEQSVNVGATVQLDGSKSIDVDNDSITYSWIQTAGYPVTLTDSKIINPKFTAPSEEERITFMLTVSDGTATSNPNVINIYVGMQVPEPTVPPAPTSLTSTVSSNSVTLAWANQDDGGSPITDYVLEYKTSDETEWTVYQDGVDDSTSMLVTDIKNSVEYDFRIHAINSVGKSELSQVISTSTSEQIFEPQDTTEPDAELTQETQRLESKKQQIHEKIKEIKKLLTLIKSRS